MAKIIFYEHRGTRAEALAGGVEFESFEQLKQHFFSDKKVMNVVIEREWHYDPDYTHSVVVDGDCHGFLSVRAS